MPAIDASELLTKQLPALFRAMLTKDNDAREMAGSPEALESVVHRVLETLNPLIKSGASLDEKLAVLTTAHEIVFATLSALEEYKANA